MANPPPSEIQTLIENHVNGFNAQNIELFRSVFADDAIIIDGIAPYRWLNPDAPADWLADVEKWRKTSGSRTSTCRTKWASGMSKDRGRTPSSLGPLR